MFLLKRVAAAGAVALFSVSASFAATVISPTGGTLPAGVSPIGGVVFDGLGLNGTRLVTQTAASTLFEGNTGSIATTITIGSQSGFDSSILGALGGGFSSVSVRVSLFDGDSAPGNFDEDDNFLEVNGLQFGNFSDVSTTNTNSTGTELGTGTGFANNRLDTGFFTVTDSSILSSLFSSLQSTGVAIYSLRKIDDQNQFYDFSQGIDSSLVNVGSGPTITPPPNGGGNPTSPNVVPLPAAGWMLLAGLGGLGLMRRRQS